MNVSPEVLDWVRKAEADLTAAHRLAAGEPSLPDQMGFFCQQSAEKYLKAFLLAWDQVPPRTHDVDVLVELCAALDPDFARLQAVVEGLTEFAVIFRYRKSGAMNLRLWIHWAKQSGSVIWCRRSLD
jgi:HEPN domain-containing protein